jgi:hypothetical protein
MSFVAPDMTHCALHTSPNCPAPTGSKNLHEMGSYILLMLNSLFPGPGICIPAIQSWLYADKSIQHWILYKDLAAGCLGTWGRGYNIIELLLANWICSLEISRYFLEASWVYKSAIVEAGAQ